MPRGKWFLRIAAWAGVVAVITMEAGWIVTEVGRLPWIVYNLMKVEDAATKNTGVWLTFIGVVAIYVVVAVTIVVVLRLLSRRFRSVADDRASGDDEGVPYGPRPAARPVDEGSVR